MMNKQRSLWAMLAVKDPRNVSKLREQSPELFEYDADVKVEGIDKVSARGVVLLH
jgi:sulfur transfer complex TusBCD TusB component (DsrH family)